jgi:hypothetical protein
MSGLSLAFTGPGLLSLDALLGFHLQGALWGAGAVLVGAAGAAIQLGGRRRAQTSQAVAA